MLLLEWVLFTAALSATALLTLWQARVFVQEYRFYRANAWDFSLDSGLDRIDQRFHDYPLVMTNWQRLFIFRPLYLAMLLFFLTAMIVSTV